MIFFLYSFLYLTFLRSLTICSITFFSFSFSTLCFPHILFIISKVSRVMCLNDFQNILQVVSVVSIITIKRKNISNPLSLVEYTLFKIYICLTTTFLNQLALFVFIDIFTILVNAQSPLFSKIIFTRKIINNLYK